MNRNAETSNERFNSFSLKSLLLSIVLVLMIWFVFGQTLTFEFVNFDDPQYVTENSLVQGGITSHGVVRALTHSEYSFYHPLTTLSHMVDFQLYGLTSAGFHLTNIFLHTLSAVILFLVLRSMTGAFWRSALVAALFAVHPLRAESVAWVTERKDCLSGVFFMLTLAAYTGYVRCRFSFWRYALVVLFVAAAMFSKATVITLPCVLLLLDYWPLKRFEKRGVGKLLLEKVPLFLLSAGMAVVMMKTAGESLHSFDSSSFSLRLANAVVSYGTYIGQTVFPVRLAVLYPFPSSVSLWKMVASFLLLGLITFGVICHSQKKPYLLTGWFWYLGMLVPMVGLVQAGGQAHADRYTYVSQIGLLIAVCWLFGRCAEQSLAKRWIAAIVAVVILAGAMSVARVQVRFWRDSVSLWNRSLACTDGNFVAHGSLGEALFVRGKTEEAIDQFKKSLLLVSCRPEVLNNLAAAFADQKEWRKAVEAERQALIYAQGNLSPEVIQIIRQRTEKYQAAAEKELSKNDDPDS